MRGGMMRYLKSNVPVRFELQLGINAYKCFKSSLTVCCAPCDEKMYRALGFDIGLGITFAHIE